MTTRSVLIQALSSTYQDIERLVLPVIKAGLNQEFGEHTVVINGILYHLILVDRTFRRVVELISQEHEPTISNPFLYKQNSGEQIQTLSGCVLFKGERDVTLAMLRNLEPGMWQRKAIDEFGGRLSVRQLTHKLVEHDIEHTNHLAEAVHSWRKKALESAGGVD